MLHQWLSNDPDFFAEVIRWTYKPKSEGKKEEDLPQELKKQRAHLAWELLNTWKTVPGCDSKDRIDYQKLKSWVEKARELCEKLDRKEACDIHIGKVLAYAMPDEDSNWPPKEVCKIIEEIKSKELEKGFIIGVYSKRGVVFKSSLEGGEQERALAKQYQEYADKLAIQFPRTSEILRKISKFYESEAKREDEEAKNWDIEW